jgi:hypothetical protein
MQGLGVFRRTMIPKCQDRQAARFDCKLRNRLSPRMDGLMFLESLLKRPKHLLFCTYVPVRHFRFDKSLEEYGTKRAASRIFSLVPSNGRHSRCDRDVLTLRAGSNGREIDARVLLNQF